jgi:hypothetical protein
MALPRRTLARAAALLLAAAVALAQPLPALAHDDSGRLERFRQEHSADLTTPIVMSDNVRHLGSQPGTLGISGCFMPTKPLFVMSGLESVSVLDVGDPAAPERVGRLDNALFENEAMNCGERRTADRTRRFALVGVDLVQASSDDPQHVNAGGNELVLVDVSEPAAPRILSRAPATTSTHTVACVDPRDCRFAYSAGNGKRFSIFDLRRLGRPREVDADPDKAGVQPFRSPTAGHKWNFDGAGYGAHTGFDGTSMFDTSRPRRPRLVTTTGAAGRGEDPRYAGYNDFIHHNSFRPNARDFEKAAPASVANGNVLFVTEEDYEQTDCSKAGSFQSWKVQRLDGRRDAIKPLDKVELADLGSFPVPQFAFCSAHWFSYHPKGIVAVGFYGGGLQLVDARDPRDLRPFGHAFTGASEVWDAYWVPRYTSAGRMTSQKRDLVYTVDLVRGLDVYQVDLPGRTRIGGPASQSVVSPLPLGLVTVALLASVAVRRRARVSP